jgi:ATP-dependent exoDNAse (exonuclease V) beta subunit
MASATDVHAGWFALNMESFDQAATIDLVAPVERQPEPSAFPTELRVGDEEEPEAEWVNRRSTVLATVGRRTQTPTALSKAGKTEVLQDNEPYRKGRGSTALGRAVHAVLQAIELTTLEGLDEMARAHATDEGIPDRALDVAGLVRKAASSQPVRRATASGRYWREVPVGARLNGSLLEGFIDLLYEDEGKLVIVDYKTDRLSPAELAGRMATYRLQGGAYALLIEAATKREVQNVTFVFPATESVRQIDDLQQAKADARQALTTAP